MPDTPSDPVKVFISYSHDSKEQEARVLELANRLRAEGVDASLDLYALTPSEELPRWMKSQIEKADFVLVVCTQDYLRKFERSGDQQRGVAWEQSLITNELYSSAAVNQKFVPILFDKEASSCIPPPLRGSAYYRVDERGYEELYRFLTNQPEYGHQPALGRLRPLPQRDSSSLPLEAAFEIHFPPAAAPSKVALIGVPPMSKTFVGRDSEIAALRRLLTEVDREPPIVTLVGLGGVGKTAIAAALARDHEVAKHFPDGILWANVGQHPDVMSNYITWARGLDLEIDRERSQQFARQALASTLGSRRCLVVLDDVWRAEDAVPYLVGSSHSATLQTTRLVNVSEALSSSRSTIFQLSSLDSESSLALLHAFDEQVVEKYVEECRELVQDLEGIPLAIQLVGSLLNQQRQVGLPVNKRLKELRKNLAEARLTARPPVEEPLMLSRTLSEVLTRSTENLSLDVRERFAMLAVFAPAPASFDLDALRSVWQVEDPRGTAMELVRLGLLNQVGNRFQIHDLVMNHARSLLEV